MLSNSTALVVPGVEEDLLAQLHAELTGDEQLMFVEGFAVFLKYDARRDFVIDLEWLGSWLGFSNKADATKAVVKHLKEGTHYKFNIAAEPEEEANPVVGDPSDHVLLTILGFKLLCMAANTENARKVREYYIAMEEIMFEYTKRKMEQHAAQLEQHATKLATAKQQLAIKDIEAADAKQKVAELLHCEEELHRLKTKTYEEVPKLDHVYICKEVAELSSQTHKVGKAIDTKKRESQLNTGSAQGTRIIYERSTLNAKVVEDMVRVAQRRYHIGTIGGTEHYTNEIEHSVNVIDVACTVMDTLASSYEYITRNALLNKLVAKINDLRLVPDDEENPLGNSRSTEEPQCVNKLLHLADPRVTKAREFIEAKINFHPMRTAEFAGRHYYAWVTEKDLMASFWLWYTNGEHLQLRSGVEKALDTKRAWKTVLRVVMKAKGRDAALIHPVEATGSGGQVHVLAFDRVAWLKEDMRLTLPPCDR